MFSIPWKHAARHGWEVDKDACLFKEWAKHTGEKAWISLPPVQNNYSLQDEEVY